MKVLPGFRATSCTGVNASITVGTMINALSHYVMRAGKMKQRYANNFTAQKKKKQNLYSRQSSDFHFM